MKFSLLAIAALMATSSSGMVSAAAPKSKKSAKNVSGGPHGGTGPSKPPSDSPSSYCEETIDSLRAAIADLEARSSALEERIVQKDSIIADLTPQTETFGVVSIDPTSQCSYEDGKLAFDTCRCNELTVLKDNACAQVPVDCVLGKERDTGLTCEKACDGQCCRGSGACSGFTGHVHRDGSCSGSAACDGATIGEVKGPSCTGYTICRKAEIGLVTESCTGDYTCKLAEVGLIEGSCNGSPPIKYESTCYDIIAVSIIDGEIDVCSNECRSAYIAAGEDEFLLSPGDSCSNDEEVAGPTNNYDYPTNYCTYLACIDECRDEGGRPDPSPEDTCGECGGCLKSSETCIYDDYVQESCEAAELLWCGPGKI